MHRGRATGLGEVLLREGTAVIIATTLNLPCQKLWERIQSADTTEGVKTALQLVKTNREVDDDTRSAMVDSLVFKFIDMRKSA